MTETARDYMQEHVITVSKDSPLSDVLRLFVEESIHGAPVVEDGELVGVISTTDLLRGQEEERDTGQARSDYLREWLEYSTPDWSDGVTDFQDRLANRLVADVMTRGLVSVPVDASVPEVARRLHENRIHRVWVVDGDVVCGVISTLDLMPALARGA